MSYEEATGERGRWIWDEDKHELVRAEKYVPKSKATTFEFISDDIHNGLIAPFNGRMYHSKSKMRADAKALGLIEVGNEQGYGEKRQRELERESQQKTHEALLESWARVHGE